MLGFGGGESVGAGAVGLRRGSVVWPGARFRAGWGGGGNWGFFGIIGDF